MGNAASIWPTTASTTKRADRLRKGDRVAVLDGRGRLVCSTDVVSAGPDYVEIPSPTAPGCIWLVDPKRAVPLRTYAIGEGLVRARQRMERFACWLRTGREEMERRTKPLIEGPSPEAFMRGLAERGRVEVLPRHWIADVATLAGFPMEWDLDDPASLGLAVCDLLASPEWASLPWQQDPGVGHG